MMALASTTSRMTVVSAKYPSAEYRGERVYFCTKACLRVFEQNPEAFMAGEVEHPLDDE